ncbi:hypothetical protein GCM10009737_03650 [Nocardioides lentus]|uniref:Penicillin-insensitive transglycosylase n=1 Tax=Nocardioides lentus TaxID=338077 RepID=A0ABN2NX49_9ACTN
MWTGVTVVLALIAGAVAFVVLYQTTDVPDPNADFQTQTSFVYYRNGDTELGEFATQNRVSIDLEQMPADLKDAVIAAENRTFWTDQGIDPRGIVRAAFSNARGNSTQGASTITQQYVKILYLSQEQTLSRKAKEALLSLKIQRQQSKEEILEGYLNTIYFGRGAYGVEAAAQAYFATPAAELTLRQSAFLASVLNNPGRYDPDGGDRAALKERYAYTLSGMAEMGTASEAEVERASRALPRFPEIEAESRYAGQRGHALEMVRSELNELGFSDADVDGGGLRVTTTFDQQVMEAAEAGVAAQRPEGFGADLHIGVASVEPGTGALRGFYGGQDYLDSQLNWAREGGQAGSTMKAYAMAEAIEQGFSLNDTFEGNSPLVLPDGSEIGNQGDTDYGSAITMLTAAENSVNTAFIDMTERMSDGPESIIDRANAMGVPPAQTPERDPYGIPTDSPGLEPVLGVALGNATVSPINMANGYATIAAEGRAAEVHVVERVTDREGNELYARDAGEDGGTEQAISEDVAADVSYALQQVVTSGSGSAALDLGRPAAGKTGTATNGDDEVSSSWFVGYTPQLSTAVMYVRGQGNEQLDGWLPEFFGGSYPARTWTDVMGRALEGTDVLEFPEPVFLDGEAPDGSVPAPTAPPETEAPAPPPSQEPQPEPQPQPQPSDEPSVSEQPDPEPPPTPDEPTEDPTTPPVVPEPTPDDPGTTPPAGGGTGGGTGGTGGGGGGGGTGAGAGGAAGGGSGGGSGRGPGRER